MKRHHTPTDDTEINITPMLDIVFIMLIFFIVTTSFVREPGIDPLRPIAQSAQPQPRANILIAVSDADTIWMQGRQVELNEVRPLVESARKETPESSAVIIADQAASAAVLLDLMTQIRNGGVGNVSVAARDAR